ncbi:hypothetical protein GSI_09345 [Ganoderma sinense ZZ0214-1]|uniref:Integrase zinc-binding domain-containing protein n=1 Tax=Ganoderma sinense ZZ0214-1 TaxID=1077348 RepID=A0A2G8S6D5_9APHY|nr:hypothetical protein GSI_09345 [Ganoderma sinense ZZ0214-1]
MQKHFGRRLAHFDVKIIYRPGRNQLAANALSRRPGHTDVPDCETLGPLFAHPLDSSAAAPATADSPRDLPVNNATGADPELPDEPAFPQGGLLWCCRHNGAGEVMVRVPTSLADARAVIRDVHQEISHLGVRAVSDALRTRVWISFPTEHVRDVVGRCNSCQFTRQEAPKPGPLHPLPRVDTFDCWAFDWIGPVHKSQRGNEYILTSIDHGTDLTFFVRSSHRTANRRQYSPTTARSSSHARSKPNYLHRLGIEHLHTTPYHPQTNGRLEKLNDNFVQTLARYVAPDRQDEWDNYVPDALLAHRAHHQRLEHVQNLERFRAEANAKGLQRLEKEASKRENAYHDRALGIGDLVLHRSENPTKLHPRWDGPFIIQDLTDRNTYQLRTRNGYVLRTLYNGERLPLVLLRQVAAP